MKKQKQIQLKPNQFICKTEKGKPVVVTHKRRRSVDLSAKQQGGFSNAVSRM